MKRITGLDLARVLMTFGIVAYHFACYSSAGLSFFNICANGVWGGIFNAAFFALSGFSLETKYGKQSYNIIQFYYKRWKTVIFPYALVFSFAFLYNATVAGRFFYLDIPRWRLILSFIGVDGYVQWFCSTYFVTGVWFVGAIIFIYLLFPLINWAINKNWICFLLILAAGYELIRLNQGGTIPIDINPIVCILSFSVGMVLSKIKPYLFTDAVFGLTAVISLFLILIPIAGSISTKQLFLGWLLFILFSNIGNHIKWNSFNHITETLSKASYPVILLHLPIIHKVLNRWDSTIKWHSLAVLFAMTIVLFAVGLVFKVILKKLYSLKGFKWLDAKIQAISDNHSA